MLVKSLKRYSLPISSTFLAGLFSINAFAYDDNQPLNQNWKIYSQLDAAWSHRDTKQSKIITDNSSVKIKNMGDDVASFTLKTGFKDIDTSVRYEIALTHYNKLSDSFSMNAAGNTLGIQRKIGSDMLMFNVAYDYPVLDQFSIYPLLGIGVSLNNLKVSLDLKETSKGNQTESASHRRTSFAWQVGAGATYDISDNLAADLSYKYVDLGSASVGDEYLSTKSSLHSSDVSLGLRYTF